MMDYTELIENLRAHCTPNCNHGRCTLLSAADCSEILARQAADAIEELQAAQKWIPVTEKLPKRRNWVLCRCVANIYEVLKYENAEWYHDPAHVYTFEFVTHWMPLPEPPKEEA